MHGQPLALLRVTSHSPRRPADPGSCTAVLEPVGSIFPDILIDVGQDLQVVLGAQMLALGLQQVQVVPRAFFSSWRAAGVSVEKHFGGGPEAGR